MACTPHCIHGPLQQDWPYPPMHEAQISYLQSYISNYLGSKEGSNAMYTKIPVWQQGTVGAALLACRPYLN